MGNGKIHWPTREISELAVVFGDWAKGNMYKSQVLTFKTISQMPFPFSSLGFAIRLSSSQAAKIPT